MKARRVNQSELNRVVKMISYKMDDFEKAVLELKELKNGAIELDDAIEEQAAKNKDALEKMERDLLDNKIRTINKAAFDMGKIIMSREELDELNNSLTVLKESGRVELEQRTKDLSDKYEEKLAQALNVRTLMHQAETALLTAGASAHAKEIDNLNASLDRMSEELKSQKLLTASVVAPRSQPSTTSQ